jgi:triacylglycerol esterase/lipase EstA (alpha/beta hydrolase family)
VIAGLLRALLIAQAALAAAIGLWLVQRRGWSVPAATAGAIALPFVWHAAFIAVQFALSAWANRGDAAARLGAAGRLRAWWQESAASIAAFNWRMPWRADAAPDVITAEPRRGVVLVHGYCCNRGLWRPLMAWLRRQRVPHAAVTLEPPFGSIDGYGRQLHAAVERLRRATGLRPLLVGHSMGGLAVRAYLAQHGASGVHGIITIGTPHHGTVHAALGGGRNAAQMRTGSDWLQRNAAQLDAAVRARFTCFYSNGDNIVAPFRTAALDGADNRLVPCTGHIALAFAPQVRREIALQLGIDA